MPVKKIVFYVMCAILAIMIIVSGITIAKAGALIQGILSPETPATQPSTSATQATDPTEGVDSSEPDNSTEETVPSGNTDSTDGDHTHNYTEYQTSSATCIEEGHTLYKCSCGDVETRDVVPALGHSYGAGKVITSCTEENYTKYECSRCGNIDKRNITPASGHKFDIEEKFPATCTDDAYTIRKCSNPNCSESETEFLTGTALGGHKYTVLKKEVAATCTENGYELYACANEGCTSEPEKKETSATGHTFGQWETVSGRKQNKCKDCNIVITADQLQITKEYSSEDGKLYVIEVGTGKNATDIRRLYTYYIEDQRSEKQNKLTYRFDATLGFIVEYKDDLGVTQTLNLGFTNDSIVIRNANDSDEDSTETWPTVFPFETELMP